MAGSSYYGEPNLGNERSVGVVSQSRKGKKSNSDKPKQPQRGLGVAQLEKIRLHSQMGGCAFLPSPPPPPAYPTGTLNHQEDMRIQTAYSSSSSFSYTSSSTASYTNLQRHQSIMMGMGELERSNIRYGESQPSNNLRWNSSNAMLEAQHYAQPGITRHLLNLEVEDSLRKKKRKDQRDSMGSSSSQNSESNGSQELDLELRLSL